MISHWLNLIQKGVLLHLLKMWTLTLSLKETLNIDETWAEIGKKTFKREKSGYKMTQREKRYKTTGDKELKDYVTKT